MNPSGRQPMYSIRKKYNIMKIIEQEILSLKTNISQMWSLVHKQLYNAGEAMLTGDRELAHKVICRERRVNAFELKIDSDCEDIIALYAPVAIDLRFVLAMYKINTNLERLGDFAEGIARFVLNLPQGEPIDPQLVKDTRVKEMLQELLCMLSITEAAFEKEDAEIVSSVFMKDNLIDEINHDAIGIIARYVETNPRQSQAALYLLGVIRKMERFGDHCTNIAEELVFFLEAKILKHGNKISDRDEDE